MAVSDHDVHAAITIRNDSVGQVELRSGCCTTVASVAC
jgi:hypothetical protein